MGRCSWYISEFKKVDYHCQVQMIPSLWRIYKSKILPTNFLFLVILSPQPSTRFWELRFSPGAEVSFPMEGERWTLNGGHVAMSGNISEHQSWDRGLVLALDDRGQEVAKHSSVCRTDPTVKNYLAPQISGWDLNVGLTYSKSLVFNWNFSSLKQGNSLTAKQFYLKSLTLLRGERFSQNPQNRCFLSRVSLEDWSIGLTPKHGVDSPESDTRELPITQGSESPSL